MVDKEVKRVFDLNNAIYGSRRISHFINKGNCGFKVSRFIVNESMKRQKLISKYCKNKSFKPYANKVLTNVKVVANLLKQNFDNYRLNEVITSDLTYVPNDKRFFYICFLLDLYNREIVGFSTSEHHDTEMVIEAFEKANIDKREFKIFHTDRGGEFKGEKLIDFLAEHDVARSMSKPGCPFDNAPSERLFRIFKTEWMKPSYNDIIELQADVKEFVHWYNHFRIHSSLNYQTPVEKRLIEYA
ncbi:MAG: IS3 family transposase [Bacilli bacterium]